LNVRSQAIKIIIYDDDFFFDDIITTSIQTLILAEPKELGLLKKIVIKIGISIKYRVLPKSWQPAELTGYLGRLCRLLLS